MSCDHELVIAELADRRLLSTAYGGAANALAVLDRLAEAEQLFAEHHARSANDADAEVRRMVCRSLNQAGRPHEARAVIEALLGELEIAGPGAPGRSRPRARDARRPAHAVTIRTSSRGSRR